MQEAFNERVWLTKFRSYRSYLHGNFFYLRRLFPFVVSRQFGVISMFKEAPSPGGTLFKATHQQRPEVALQLVEPLLFNAPFHLSPNYADATESAQSFRRTPKPSKSIHLGLLRQRTKSSCGKGPRIQHSKSTNRHQ